MAVMPELSKPPILLRPPMPHLAAELFGRPLMCLPAKVDMIIAGLGSRLLGGDIQGLPLEAFTTAFGEARQPGYRIIDGVGIIDVFGVLAHHGGFSADSSYVMGYDTIVHQLDAALVDDDVKSIVLNMDSPGGSVAGAFDAADLVAKVNETKPVHAAIGDTAASAAYLIASAAESISITRTGLAGSIGVVMRHVDVSKRIKKDGMSVTFIHAGAHKVDGHPFAPLSAAVFADLQAEVDKVYALLVDTVGIHRDMPESAIRATEARMYSGEDAVKMGLADRVETPDQLIARLSGRSKHQQEAIMPKENTPPLTAETTPLIGDLSARYDAGLTAGASAERTRIRTILCCEAGLQHPEAAETMAFTTDMSAEDAERVLASLPKEVTATLEEFALSPLAAAMHNAGTPGVGDGGGDAAGPPSDAQAILKDFNSATGTPVSH